MFGFRLLSLRAESLRVSSVNLGFRIWGSGVQAQGFQGMHKTFGFAGCRSNLRELGMKVCVCVQRLAILTPTNLYRNSHIEHFDPGSTS